MTTLPVLALTPGEPAGIGPDLCVGLAAPRDHALVLIADPDILQARATLLGGEFSAAEWPGRAGAGAGLYLAPLAAVRRAHPGRLDAANAPYVLAALRRAVQGCLAGEFDALVTGPVHKGVINDAGIAFSGHTEFLAAESKAPTPVMMLATRDLRVGRSRHPGPEDQALNPSDTSASLRVALATTHLPLAEVPRAITRERLTAVLEVLHADLRTKFGIAAPRILVCGLNPHAGESGHLGREEIEVIEPVIHALVARGLRLTGPVPADTAFIPRSLAQADAVLAMYHDQGLPVLKHHDFAHAVNVTLGLPFVRTSVDHGTALELAGSGRADGSSLAAALALALDLVRARR
jgi:4-hydroxythreonine-4-phosphate dehydrogenase